MNVPPPTTRRILAQSLSGGACVAAVLFLAMRVTDPTPPPTADSTAVAQTRTAKTKPAKPELWIGDRRVSSARDYQVGRSRTTNREFQEVYLKYGDEMAESQRRQLQEEVRRGEDLDEANLERLGLTRHDNDSVLRKMDEEGVVIW